MTVQELLDKLEKEPMVAAPEEWREDYKKIVLSAMEVWSGNSCKGYTLTAARAIGLDKDTRRALLEEMGAAFDEMTLEEAAALYENGAQEPEEESKRSTIAQALTACSTRNCPGCPYRGRGIGCKYILMGDAAQLITG